MNNKAHLRPNDYDKNGDIIPDSVREEKGDTISREALKKKLQARHDNGEEDFDKGYNIGIETAIDLIDNAPTVEAVPLEFHEKCMDKTVRELLERPQVVIFSENMTEEEKQKLIAEFKSVMDNAKFTVEPERPKGTWLIEGGTTLHYACSECGCAGDKWDKFCKHCGTDMRGDK